VGAVPDPGATQPEPAEDVTMTNAPIGERDWRPVAGAGPAPSGSIERAGRAGLETVPTEPAAASAAVLGRRVLDAVTSVVLGHDRAVRLAVAAFLAGGHVLVEDSPGVGKTLLGKALARAVGGTFGRVQATADLLPSDITGVSVHDPDERTWSFRPGPVFNHVVLVDELNRATPRAQSALLEAMAEGHVTVDGTTHPLPRPFFVIATQNPRGDHGTFPLVAGQRDRFAARLHLGIPSPAVERALLRGHGGDARLRGLDGAAPPGAWVAAQDAVAAVHVSDAVVDYLVHLATTARAHPAGDPDLSPRATLALQRVAQAAAALDGRDFVLPDDVKEVAGAVLGHRLGGDLGAGGEPARSAERVATVLAAVAVPPTPR
jgi:MoxR-like ATPase